MEKPRCQKEGCKAYPRKGADFCVRHPDGGSSGSGGAPMGNQNARVHGLYSAYVPVVALQDALKSPPGDLRLEIAVVRALISELLRAQLSIETLVEAVDKATGALARLMRVNKQLSDDDVGEFESEVGRLLADLGLGR